MKCILVFYIDGDTVQEDYVGPFEEINSLMRELHELSKSVNPHVKSATDAIVGAWVRHRV